VGEPVPHTKTPPALRLRGVLRAATPSRGGEPRIVALRPATLFLISPADPAVGARAPDLASDQFAVWA
jgi:hypothetical protein